MSKAALIGKLYRPDEAAELLGVSTRHVRNLINDGEIIVVRLGADARADRIEETELQRFIMRRRVNRGIAGVKECLSINVVKSGGSNSSIKTPLLDNLRARRKRQKH